MTKKYKPKKVYTTGNPDSRGTHMAHDKLNPEDMGKLEEEYSDLLKRNEPQELIKKQERLKKEIEDKKHELKEAEKQEISPEQASHGRYSHTQIKGPPKPDANTGKVFERIIQSGDKGLTEDEILGYTQLDEKDQFLPKHLKSRKARDVAKEKNVPIMTFDSNFKREFGLVKTGSMDRKGMITFDPIKKTYVANKKHKIYHEFVSTKQKIEEEKRRRKAMGE